MRKLSVGLLIGDKEPSRWFTRAVEQVVTECGARVDRVVVPETVNSGRDRSLRHYLGYALKNGCWTPMDLLNRLRDGGRMDEVRELRGEPITSVSGVTPDLLTTCELKNVGTYRVALPDAEIRAMSDLDVVFHVGVGILSGGVLDSAKYGVWGVHHGDVRKYRGGPPGFWEYVNREETAVITLQRYTEELDGGRVILENEVDISSARTWPEVRRIMCQEMVSVFMKGVTRHVQEGKSTYSVDKLGPIYSRSDRNCVTLLKYLSRTVPGRIRIALNPDPAKLGDTEDDV